MMMMIGVHYSFMIRSFVFSGGLGVGGGGDIVFQQFLSKCENRTRPPLHDHFSTQSFCLKFTVISLTDRSVKGGNRRK